MVDRTREHLIETYRKKAKHYDVTSRLYPAPGYPQRAQRLRAVQSLGLRPGASVIDIALARLVGKPAERIPATTTTNIPGLPTSFSLGLIL